MVKNCKEYNETEYNEYFDEFVYTLSDFQKHSIQAIIDGNHSLVCANTGNGKTLSAEFAIKYFTSQGKRLIYTVPLKSLGNQKFYDFSKMFPNITFGLLTGDVKSCPNAQVLIMTQEILMNFLFLSKDDDKRKQLQFQIDIKNELGAVVMDECHFIMDKNRGSAWECSLLMLPSNIQLIMLSATLGNPVKLASWIENRYIHDDKEVIISSTIKRIIPLIHHVYLTTNESIFKKIKDKTVQQQIRNSTDSLITIKSENGLFQESSYNEIKRIKNLFENNNVYLKRNHVLNNLAKLLYEEELLPAIFYTFSRKNVENCAREITTNLLEFDSKIPYTIRNESEQILRKLPNFKEYIALSEYETLIKLLEKGIGIHHSGMIPVLREIVELFISKGYIKILFCTDSFSVGLNCPIKTTVFTGFKKFDGKDEKYLEPHLYSQCSGRAGRRGKDTIGHVIHCSNLFDIPLVTEYKYILCGKPQKMESKFRISYEIILNLIKKSSGCKFKTFTEFIEKSMINKEIEDVILIKKKYISDLEMIQDNKYESIKYLRTPIDIMNRYMDLITMLPLTQNKKRKETERYLRNILDEHKYCIDDVKIYKNIALTQKNLEDQMKELYDMENFIHISVDNICNILIKENFIIKNDSEYIFTERGKIVSQITEIHPLVLGENFERLQELSVKQLIGLLSCFTDIRVSFDTNQTPIKDDLLTSIITDINKSFQKYYDYEYEYRLNTGYEKTSLIYDIIEYVQKWSDAQDELSCKLVIQELFQSINISVGEFSKAILKISVISKELMNICEVQGYIELKKKLTEIDAIILKYICTNQSLYI